MALVARLHLPSDLAALRRYATLLHAFSLDRPATALPALARARRADLNE